MKFRCPYCKHVFEPGPGAVCPACGKMMTIPDHLRPARYASRKKVREQFRRQQERERVVPAKDFMFTRKPVVLLGLTVLLMVVGLMLIGRVKYVYPVETPQLIAGKDLKVLRIALERFRRDCGRYPSKEEGLDALVLYPGVPGWCGNYVNMIKPDPWARKYCYDITNGVITLFSLGPDAAQGADDIIPEAPTPDEVENGLGPES